MIGEAGDSKILLVLGLHSRTPVVILGLPEGCCSPEWRCEAGSAFPSKGFRGACFAKGRRSYAQASRLANKPVALVDHAAQNYCLAVETPWSHPHE